MHYISVAGDTSATVTLHILGMNYVFVAGDTSATVTLHILGMLKDILALFAQNSIKSTCEAILRVMIKFPNVVGSTYHRFDL